jgi:hypothetical protein
VPEVAASSAAVAGKRNLSIKVYFWLEGSVCAVFVEKARSAWSKRAALFWFWNSRVPYRAFRVQSWPALYVMACLREY